MTKPNYLFFYSDIEFEIGIKKNLIKEIDEIFLEIANSNTNYKNLISATEIERLNELFNNFKKALKEEVKKQSISCDHHVRSVAALHELHNSSDANKFHYHLSLFKREVNNLGSDSLLVSGEKTVLIALILSLATAAFIIASINFPLLWLLSPVILSGLVSTASIIHPKKTKDVIEVEKIGNEIHSILLGSLTPKSSPRALDASPSQEELSTADSTCLSICAIPK